MLLLLNNIVFNYIWLEKHGKLIQLWGEFNPKVLLMDEEGEITSRELTSEELLEIKKRRLDNKVIGEKLDNGGVVVSDGFAKDFMEGKSNKTFDDLQNMDAEDICKLSGNAEGTRELRSGIEGLQPKNFQAHHVIPRELGKKFKDFFEKIGFNIENGKINGIMVPPSVLRVAKLDVDIPIGNEFDDYARHLGSHPNYTDRIKLKIEKIELDFRMGRINDEQALVKIIEVTDKAKAAIKIGKGKVVNDIIF